MKLVRLRLTGEQESLVRLEEAKRGTGINGLLAVIHQEWDATGVNGLVLIMEIVQFDAKTSRIIVKLIQQSLRPRRESM